jgi:uncharacterized membrane protein YdjX (TVP38/TMEM64 family)
MAARARRFGPLALVALLVVAAFASGLARHFSLGELKARHAELQILVRLHPVISLCAYVGLYALVVALSLPVALIMTLSGGLLFGAWIGGAAAAAGCTLGAAGIFLICRTAAGDVLQRRAGATAARIAEGVRRDAFTYVLLLRLVPVTPFWMANLALGLVDIPFLTFFVASFLGIVPTSLVYAGLGAGLSQAFAAARRPDLGLVFKPQILAPLLGLAALSALPILLRRRKRRG